MNKILYPTICRLLVIAAGLAFSARAFATVFTIQPGPSDGKDVLVSRGGEGTEFRANENNGASESIGVGMIGTNGGLVRTLLQFDLSGLGSGQTVSSARLGLTIIAPDPQHIVEIYRMTQSWVEGTGIAAAPADGATWQTYDSTNAWPGASGFRTLDAAAYHLSSAVINTPMGSGLLGSSFIGQQTWFDLDTATIQQWLDGGVSNYGMLIRSVDETSPASSQIFASSEHATVAWRPILEVTAVPEPSAALLAFTSAGWLLRRRRR